MTVTANTATLTSLLVAFAVFVSGVHGKDLALPLTDRNLAAQKQVDDPNQTAKVAHDLHHHSDTSVKVQQSDGHQADTRSLRLLNHRKAQPGRLADRLRMWWQQSSLHLS